MNYCCDPKWFGGIGIGRMSDFCQISGVEAQMTTCRCRNRCGCSNHRSCRQEPTCGRDLCGAQRQDDDCGYTTTSCC